MTMPCNIRDREHDKFKETAGGNTSVRTCIDTSGGPVEVEITEGGGGVRSNLFDSAVVVSGATSNIVSFTVPAGKELELELIEFSGSNIATYEVEINGSVEAKRRTWFNGTLSGEFIFNKLLVDENLIIRLRVENFRPSSGDFEGRILGVLSDK